MTKIEFLQELRELLSSLPTEERLSAVKYYEEYFEEAGPEQEQAILRELGSPRTVADSLLRDYSGVPATAEQVEKDNASSGEKSAESKTDNSTDQKNGWEWVNRTIDGNDPSQMSTEQPWYKKMPVWGWVIIGLFLWPLAGVVIGLVSGVLGLLGGLLVTAATFLASLVIAGIALVIGGIACLVAGVLALPVSVTGAAVTIGIGMVLTALGVLVSVFGVKFLLWAVPKLFSWVCDLCKRIVTIVKGWWSEK